MRLLDQHTGVLVEGDNKDVPQLIAQISALSVFLGTLAGVLREKRLLDEGELESVYETASAILPVDLQGSGDRALFAIRLAEKAVLGIVRD
jgi:hypothetical protein